MRERSWLLILAAIAFVIRVGWALLISDREPRFDENAYIGHAERLSEGQGYVDTDGNPTAHWPVGFPALLSLAYRLFGSNLHTGVALQILLGVLTCLLLSIVGERLLGRRIGRMAGFMLATYPNSIFYSTLQLAEPLYTLLLLGAVSCLVSSQRKVQQGAIAAGALIGSAALTRTDVLLFPALLPLWYHINGHRWRAAMRLSLWAACAALIVVSPWMIRNRLLPVGSANVDSKAGGVFWAGNHPTALGGYVVPREVMSALRNEPGKNKSHGLRLGWESIKTAPGAALRRSLQKISYFFAMETDGVLWNLKGLRTRPSLYTLLPLLVIANLAYLVVVSSAFLGIVTPPRHRSLATLLSLLTTYFLMVTVVFFGDPRYHYPLIPIALLFSSKALLEDWAQVVTGLRSGNHESWRLVMTWAVLGFLFFLLMAVNLWLKYLEAQRFDPRW